MPRFTAIHSIIWRDEEFNRLSDRGKLLFLYILSSPHSNMIGLYLLPRQYISHDMGWDMKTVSNVQKELMDLDLVRFDKHEIVHIPSFLKHNPVRNLSQMKGAVNTLKNLPKSVFKERVIESLHESVEMANDTVKDGMEGALRGPLGPLEEARSKRIKDKDTIINNPSATPCGEDKTDTSSQKAGKKYLQFLEEKFLQFWRAYPRKVDKKRAREKFYKLFDQKVNLETRNSRLNNLDLHLQCYVEECYGKEEKYIKHPATWLNSVDFDSPPEPQKSRKMEWSDTNDDKP